jgi:uncharacterized membrane protein YhaH (DUF805 family)
MALERDVEEMPPELTWRRLFVDLTGRVDREMFWIWGFLPWIILSWAFALIVLYFLSAPKVEIFTIGMLLISAVFVPIIVKRLHDRNRPGWLVLLYFIPAIYGSALNKFARAGMRPSIGIMLLLLALDVLWVWFFVLECGVFRGTVGSNRFGAAPMRFRR